MKLVIRNFVEFFFALLLVYSVVFFLINALPTDPARAILGPLASQGAVDQLRSDYGLDLPVSERYFKTLIMMSSGNFGQSIFYQQPASTVIGEMMPLSLARAGMALVIGGCLGLVIGYLMGKTRVRGHTSLALFYSIPSFCVMVLLLWGASQGGGWTPMGDPWAFEVLAVFGVALYPASAIARQISDRLNIDQHRPTHVDFLLMLHVPNKSLARILWLEGMPEAIAILINSIPAVLTAVTFAEIVLNMEGFGKVFIESSERGDLPIVVGGSLVLSAIMLAIHSSGDIIIRTIDPRFSSDE